MLGEFLVRLAVALPLVCGLAALSLWAMRRGWFRLPMLRSTALLSPAFRHAAPGPIEVVAVKSMSPTARLAVIRFDGQDLLLGLTGQSIALLARTGTATPPPQPAVAQEQAL